MNKAEKDKYGAVIVAAGSSLRFGTKNKLFEKISGVPVFIRSIQSFIELCADRIILVVNQDNEQKFAKIAKEYFPKISIRYTEGGDTRAESVYNGLNAFSDGEINLVAIHDAARPLLDAVTLRLAFDFASVNGSAVFSSKITDTVKYLDNPDSGIISRTIDRNHLRAVQTPQIFRFQEIKKAYQSLKTNLKSFTDDSAVMEAFGFEVKIFSSPSVNIKITRPHDILIAEALLRQNIEKPSVE
jgi:2-C-methyl-D-erythritol 4-phosphate cytidylyltransferase